MKAILVPVEAHELIEATLETALLMATRFGSLVEGLALRPAIPTAMAFDPAGAAMIESPDWDAEHTQKEARALFEGFMTRKGVAAETAGNAVDAPCWTWTRPAPEGSAFVGSYGRVFDVTVVGRPGTRPMSPRMSTLEASLFESGRPIVIAPPTAPRSLGGIVAVAWNGSTETARAISFAKPLLRRAERVVILSGEAGELNGPPGDQVARHLTHNGIRNELRMLAPGQFRSGEAILVGAAKEGADLLVKGAYTQSRLRQLIFGGATSHIISETEIAVLMAH